MPKTLPDPLRLAAEGAVYDHLANGRYRDAAVEAARFEAQQQEPRGIGIDWSNYNPSTDVSCLRKMYGPAPGILDGITADALPQIRYAAAMQYLWGGLRRRWLDKTLVTGTRFTPDQAARMLVFFARSTLNVTSVAEAVGRPIRVRVSVVGDPRTCEQCRALSKQTFTSNAMPEMPNPTCTAKEGCRCILSADQ